MILPIAIGVGVSFIQHIITLILTIALTMTLTAMLTTTSTYLGRRRSLRHDVLNAQLARNHVCGPFGVTSQHRHSDSPPVQCRHAKLSVRGIEEGQPIRYYRNTATTFKSKI